MGVEVVKGVFVLFILQRGEMLKVGERGRAILKGVKNCRTRRRL